MIKVHAHAEIDRSPQVVFDFLADMSNNPKWQKGMQECRWTSDPPLQLGSTYDQVARFLGKEIVSSFVVTEFAPGHRIRIQTTSGTMPIDVIREVGAVADGRSSVSATVTGDPSGVFRPAAPLMRLMVSRSIDRDYRRLKELLES